MLGPLVYGGRVRAGPIRALCMGGLIFDFSVVNEIRLLEERGVGGERELRPRKIMYFYRNANGMGLGIRVGAFLHLLIF